MQESKNKRNYLFLPLGICHKLFSFIMDNLISRGFKRVTTTAYSLRQGSTAVSIVAAKPTSSTTTQVNRVEYQQLGLGPATTGFKQQANCDQADDSAGKMGPSVYVSDAWAQTPETAQVHEHETEEKARDFEEEERIRRRKGKSVIRTDIDTELAVKAEPSEEVKLRNCPPLRQRQRLVRPLFDVAVNINEKSDAFIRSRKEAMRRNYSSEANMFQN